MANTSIFAAFERFWQHVVVAIGDKADALHTHDDRYYTETEIDNIVSGLGGSGSIEVDPELNDYSTNPVQNKIVNAAISNLNSLVGDAPVSEQINEAIEDHNHSASDIDNGILAMENGGTEAGNSVDALKNLVAGNTGESLPAAGNTGRMFFLPSSKAPFAPATESDTYPGCYYRTVNGATEWITPPMVYGEEYRTTERFNEKPVYIKAVNHGSLSSGSQTIAHGISGITNVIGLDVMNGTYGFFSHSSDVHCSADGTNVNINAAWNMGSCIYVIKYTK